MKPRPNENPGVRRIGARRDRIESFLDHLACKTHGDLRPKPAVPIKRPRVRKPGRHVVGADVADGSARRVIAWECPHIKVGEAAGEGAERRMGVGEGEVLLRDVLHILVLRKARLEGFQTGQSGRVPVSRIHVVCQPHLGVTHGDSSGSDAEPEEVSRRRPRIRGKRRPQPQENQ